MLSEQATAVRNRPALAEKIILHGHGDRLDGVA
jgi:hypothetical protein